MMCERIIEKDFDTGGITMGRGGFGIIVALAIFSCLQLMYGMPTAQEEDDVTARFDLPMN